MERLITKIAAGTSDFDSISSGSSTNKGLDKLLALAGISQAHTNLLFGAYLGQRREQIKLKGYLLLRKDQWFTGSNEIHSLKLVNGAVSAITNNSYKSVECYKCAGTGVIKSQACTKCLGIGQTAQKPKEYQLCGFSRSLWYKKEYKHLRDSFTGLIDMLLVLDGELRKSIAINNRDNY